MQMVFITAVVLACEEAGIFAYLINWMLKMKGSERTSLGVNRRISFFCFRFKRSLLLYTRYFHAVGDALQNF